MIELGPGADLFRMVGGLFWILAFCVLLAALWIPKGWIAKLGASSLVVVLFVAFPGRWAWEQKQESDAFRARLSKAEALFKERCKTAGEKIYRTVEGVEGVVLMKWRSTKLNLSDQFRLDDPYGRDCGGEECILQLLRVTEGQGLNKRRAAMHQQGYRYVESQDPVDGNYYRYTTIVALGPLWTPEEVKTTFTDKGRPIDEDVYDVKLIKSRIDKPSARYGITWDDISTREDREQWIAGGAIKVIDLQNNEVIAERVGYMMDRGLGGGAGVDRSPWGFANNWACPEFKTIGEFDSRRARSDENRLFVWKALRTIQGR